MLEIEECPKCNVKLFPRFTSGRLVCTKCGWSDRPNKLKIEKDNETRVPKVMAILGRVVNNKRQFTYGLGTLLLGVGLLIMLFGLFYDTSVESRYEYSSSRIVNDGRVSDRETITNFGGFLFISGAIFFCRDLKKQDN